MRGHEIVFGVRQPDSPKMPTLLETIGAGVRAVSVQDAAAFSEIVVLAVAWAAVADTLSQAGDLKGKIVVDATNRIGPAAPAGATSYAEEVARLAPGSRVVKAFNVRMAHEGQIDGD